MRRMKRAGICLWVCCLLAVSLPGAAGCGKTEDGLAEQRLAEQEEETVQETPLASLGEDVISLEEAVFYTRMLQESWESTYFEHYGEDMWQEVLDEETGTLSEALKRDVLDALAEIHLLCFHAAEYEVELSKEEKAVIGERAGAFMESNTPKVLEAAGATKERVEAFLLRNELAAKTAAAMQASYEPEVDEEAARVGKLTYALFATTGTFDAQGNQTPFTEEELLQVLEDAKAFGVRARELGDIAKAGKEISHTVIDVYFNEETDGGAHELVAAEARSLEPGGISGMIETAEGYYIVQRVSEYDEEATLENIEYQKAQARAEYVVKQVETWLLETPLQVDEKLWAGVRVDEMLTDPAASE